MALIKITDPATKKFVFEFGKLSEYVMAAKFLEAINFTCHWFRFTFIGLHMCNANVCLFFQVDDAAIQVYKNGDYGTYLDLESSLDEQSEEIEGLNAKWVKFYGTRNLNDVLFLLLSQSKEFIGGPNPAKCESSQYNWWVLWF